MSRRDDSRKSAVKKKRQSDFGRREEEDDQQQKQQHITRESKREKGGHFGERENIPGESVERSRRAFGVFFFLDRRCPKISLLLYHHQQHHQRGCVRAGKFSGPRE